LINSPSGQILLDLLLGLGLAAGLLSGRLSAGRAFAVFILAVIMTGRLPLTDTLDLLTSPAIIAVSSLVIVSSALAKLPWLPRMLFGRAGQGKRTTLARFLGSVAVMSAATPNTAVVGAALGPATRNGTLTPRECLLPLSYMALAGGMLTPFGTSASLLVVAEAARSGLMLDVLDFTRPGLAVVVGVYLCLVFVSPYLLKAPPAETSDNDDFYYLQARVESDSSLIGRSIEQNQLRKLHHFFLAEIVRGDRTVAPVAPQEIIQPGDRLIFVGDVGNVDELRAMRGLSLDSAPRSRGPGAQVHAVIATGSVLAGRTLREIDFRARFDASVVAVRRGESRLSGKLGDIRLQAGDELVLAAGSDFRHRSNIKSNLHLLDLDNPGLIPLSRRGSAMLLGCFGLFLVGALSQMVSFALISLLLAGLVVLAGWVPPREARRVFPFELIIVLWGAIVLSELIRDSGAADVAADLIVTYAGSLSPIAALAAIFLMAWVMTELFSNTSAALTALPVAFVIAERLALQPDAFVLATAFGASASFLMPYGYQTHLMVMTPGRYGLGHFLRMGSIVFLVYATLSITSLSVLYL